MEANHELDFDLLLKGAIEIGNRLTGQNKPTEIEGVYYAEGLGQKIIHHCLSVRHLFKGYQLVTDAHVYGATVDFASIAILVRAALETYLTLHHVFVASKDPEELRFRFLCWHLGGYLDRADFEPQNQAQISLKESEAQAIAELRANIQLCPSFLALNSKLQKLVLKGNWRIDKVWADLAAEAGFQEAFFRQQYKFLCGYAHSSRLSIIQIQQRGDVAQQKALAKASVGVAMVVLAKFMFDYINLIPALREAQHEFEAYPMIFIWKSIGEGLIK
jgi:hypothetical protein